MKKLIMFIVFVLTFSFTAYAGSIPEDLLSYDGAQIFFGEVTDVYSSPKGMLHVEVLPWKVVKGDVNMDPESRIVYTDVNIVGNYNVKKGKTYLFTYFDENNPTDIFDVTTFDTSTLKLKNTTGDMWERFEKNLNDGKYEEAERERIDRINSEFDVEGENVLLADIIGVQREDVKNVHIHYFGAVYDIDVNEFYNAIDGIMLTDIENVSLEKRNGDSFVLPNGMYITVNGFDGYVFITDDCKVDKHGMHYSSLPVGAYTIKTADYAKLRQFVADKEENHIDGEVIRWFVLALLVFAFVIVYAKRRRKVK